MVKDLYLCGRRMQVSNGELTSFWGHAWCGHCPLKDSFPDIYNICNEQMITLAGAAALGWRFTLRRWMSPDFMEQMNGLLGLLIQINLTDAGDRPFWKWTKNGIFSVRSTYKHLCSNGINRAFRHLWKIKIPLKIKIAMAHMAQCYCHER
jgi:hypothetical protein